MAMNSASSFFFGMRWPMYPTEKAWNLVCKYFCKWRKHCLVSIIRCSVVTETQARSWWSTVKIIANEPRKIIGLLFARAHATLYTKKKDFIKYTKVMLLCLTVLSSQIRIFTRRSPTTNSCVFSLYPTGFSTGFWCKPYY